MINTDTNLDIETLHAIAPYFWASRNETVSDEIKSQVIDGVHIIVIEHPFDPDRAAKVNPTLTRQTYLERCFLFSLKLALKGEEIREFELACTEVEESDLYQEEMRRVGHVRSPLLWKPALETESPTLRKMANFVLRDKNGDQVKLKLAPYMAKFAGGCEAGIFIEKPYHIPFFRLVPKFKKQIQNGEFRDIVAHRKSGGKRRDYTHENLGAVNARQADAMLKDMGEELRDVLKHYLRHHGFMSLAPWYWGILADVNKFGLRPCEICRKRKITVNQYNAYRRVLERRGWLEVPSNKRKRNVLMYFPIFDQSSSLYSAMKDLRATTPAAIMRLTSMRVDRFLYSDKVDDQTTEKALHDANQFLLKSFADQEVHTEWEKKLKVFIIDFVSMPVLTGVDMEKAEHRFKLLSEKDRLRIFCEAKRRQASLWDVMEDDLHAVFADALAEEDALIESTGMTMSDIQKHMDAVFGVIDREVDTTALAEWFRGSRN